MAQRRRKTQDQVSDVTQDVTDEQVQDSNTNNNTNHTSNKENTMAANQLDAALIAQLLSTQKSRGEYDATVQDFLESGVAGIEVPLDSGVFAGKPAKTIKTGLDLARKRVKDGKVVHEGGDKLRAIVATDGEGEDATEHVYLINTALTGQELDEDGQPTS